MPASKTAKKSSPVKKSSKPSKTTPKPKTSKKAGKVFRIRDLESLSEVVQRKIQSLTEECGFLQGIKQKSEDFSTAIETKTKEHDERVGKVENYISSYKLNSVQEALKRNHKVAIDKFEYTKLKELRELKNLGANESKKEVKKEVNEEVARQVRFQQEKFEERYATHKAKNAVFEAERNTLQATIAGLRAEIESQKSLSSEIAKANQQHKINEARRKAIEEHQRKEDASRGLIPAPVAAVPAAAPVAPATPAKAAAPARAAAPVPKKAAALQKKASATSATSATAEDSSSTESSTEDESPTQKSAKGKAAPKAAPKKAKK